MPGPCQIAGDKGHNQQEIELETRIFDKESSELSKLDEQFQEAYKKIDEIQKRIDKNSIDEKDTSDEATGTDTRPQHISGETA